jgi:hypothetical protein
MLFLHNLTRDLDYGAWDLEVVMKPFEKEKKTALSAKARSAV